MLLTPRSLSAFVPGRVLSHPRFPQAKAPQPNECAPKDVEGVRSKTVGENVIVEKNHSGSPCVTRYVRFADECTGHSPLAAAAAWSFPTVTEAQYNLNVRSSLREDLSKKYQQYNQKSTPGVQSTVARFVSVFVLICTLSAPALADFDADKVAQYLNDQYLPEAWPQLSDVLQQEILRDLHDDVQEELGGQLLAARSRLGMSRLPSLEASDNATLVLRIPAIQAT